jgi:hypothetical protein
MTCIQAARGLRDMEEQQKMFSQPIKAIEDKGFNSLVRYHIGQYWLSDFRPDKDRKFEVGDTVDVLWVWSKDNKYRNIVTMETTKQPEKPKQDINNHILVGMAINNATVLIGVYDTDNPDFREEYKALVKLLYGLYLELYSTL